MTLETTWALINGAMTPTVDVPDGQRLVSMSILTPPGAGVTPQAGDPVTVNATFEPIPEPEPEPPTE